MRDERDAVLSGPDELVPGTRTRASRRRRRVIFAAAAALAAAIAVGAAARATTSSALAVQGQWLLDEIANVDGKNVAADATPDANHGTLSETTVVSVQAPVAPDGGRSFLFPGWNDGSGDGTVDVEDSALVLPHADRFNPGAGPFRISVWVRPADSRGKPFLAKTDTPNVIQKGMFQTPGGQWKLSLFKDLRPLCMFRGDVDPGAGVTIETRRAAPRNDGRPGRYLRPWKPHRLECSLEDGVVTLRWYDLEAKVTRGPYRSPQPAGYFSVANTAPVWVGKKPNDTTAGDTYSGRIDNLVILSAE